MPVCQRLDKYVYSGATFSQTYIYNISNGNRGRFGGIKQTFSPECDKNVVNFYNISSY